MSTAFGTGWLERVIRGRFGVAGPQPNPIDLAPLAQVSIDARPSLFQDYGTARWFPVGAATSIAGGGAGTFASIRCSVVAASRRALVIEEWSGLAMGACELALHVNQAFVNPTVGFGLRDGRYLSAGSWLTPVSDIGLGAQNVAAGADPATNAIDYTVVSAANIPYNFRSLPLLILPGQTVAMWAYTANMQIRSAVSGYLVPIEDIGQ